MKHLIAIFFSVLYGSSATAELDEFSSVKVDISDSLQTLACGFSHGLSDANFGLNPLEVLILGKAPTDVQDEIDLLAMRYQAFERIGRVQAYTTTADVAIAFMHDGAPYIAYNADKLDRLKIEYGDESIVAIFAHELAHVYLGHLHSNSPPKEKELEADLLAGKILQSLPISKPNSRVAYEAYADENASSKYPARDERLAALISGWEKSCEFDDLCNPNAEVRQSQLDAAHGNIVVDHVDIFPAAQSARYSRQMESMVDAISIRVGTYMSSTGLQEIDSDVANIGFFPMQLGSSVFRSSPNTVYSRGQEISALGIVMGDAQIDEQSGEINLNSSFFVQGDHGGPLSHRHEIGETFPAQSIAPSVMAREYLSEEWYKFAVLSKVSRKLLDAKASNDIDALEDVRAMLLTLRAGLGQNDPALRPIERYLAALEAN